MKPYYQENGITIYYGDCREVMPALERADLVLTDPPYNAVNLGAHAKVYAGGQAMKLPANEYASFCAEWFGKAVALAPTVVFTSGIANVCLYPQPDWMVCWHKPSAVGFNRLGGYNAWEPILIYGKAQKKLGQDYYRLDPVNFSIGFEKDHPCPKPLKLWTWILDKFCPEGGTVIDPFLGSGTTLKAAKNLGLNAIGIEWVEEYCEIAANRLRQRDLPFEMRCPQLKSRLVEQLALPSPAP